VWSDAAAIPCPQALVCQASQAPDRAEVVWDLCDREVIAVLAAAARAVADRDLAKEDTQTQLQDDFAISGTPSTPA
jgi:hypothetical protein